MATISIANLPAFVDPSAAAGDLLVMVDVSDLSASPRGTTKRMTVSQMLGGTVAAASKLSPGRNINGVLFDGTIDVTVPAAAGTLTGTALAPNVVDSSLTSVGPLTSLTVVGAINGTLATAAQPNITSVGTLTNLTVTNPITGSVNGNAATATKLQAARTINGVAFDGTANITVPAAAGTLTGATLAANVVSSSLTSVGTLTSLAVSGGTTLSPDVVIGPDPGGAAILRVGGRLKAEGTFAAAHVITNLSNAGFGLGIQGGGGNNYCLNVSSFTGSPALFEVYDNLVRASVGPLVVGPDPGGPDRLRIGGDTTLNGVVTIKRANPAILQLATTNGAVSDYAYMGLVRGGTQMWRVGLNISSTNVDQFEIWNEGVGVQLSISKSNGAVTIPNNLLLGNTLVGNQGVDGYLNMRMGTATGSIVFLSHLSATRGVIDTNGNLQMNGSITSQAGFSSPSNTPNVLVSSTPATGNSKYIEFTNAGCDMLFGIENSGGSSLLSGSTPYACVLGTSGARAVEFFTNNTKRLRLGPAGELGFFGGAGVGKPTITGSRGGNAALASLIFALSTFNLLTDSTTA